MLRKFVKSPYVKASIAVIVSGSILIMLSNVLNKTKFTAGIAIVNKTLMPVYIGVFLAFLLCPIYNRLVKEIYTRLKALRSEPLQTPVIMCKGQKPPKSPDKISTMRKNLVIAKVAATVVSMFILIGFIAVVAYFALPQIIKSVINLVNTMPERLSEFSAWSGEHLERFPQIKKWINDGANAGTSQIIKWLQENAFKENFQDIAALVSAQIMKVIIASMNFFIGILISIYLLNYKETIFADTRKIIAATCSEQKARNLYEFQKIINETFIGYIVGRILDAIVIGILTYVCMTIFRMPLAPLIAVIVGVTNIIPFFGPFMGAIPSFCLLMLENPIQALYFIILILVIQQLDGNIIGPKIVGNAIGISSFWVLIAVLVGGGLFGFLGMALGVPVFAVFYRYAGKLTNSRLRKLDKIVDVRSYTDYAKFGVEKGEIFDDDYVEHKRDK